MTRLTLNPNAMTEQSKTVNILIDDLCNEIDHYKALYYKYKSLYEDELRSSAIRLNEDLERSKIDVANALMFALSIQDKPDGSLTITKENRDSLAENFISSPLKVL